MEFTHPYSQHLLLIEEYNGDFELIVVVELNIAKKKLRIMTGYGPQEIKKRGGKKGP